MGVFVLKKNPKSSTNRSLSYFCLSIFGWLLGYSLIYCSGNGETAYRFAKLTFLSVVFIPFTYLYFNLTFVDSITNHKKLIIINLILTTIYILFSQTHTIYDGVTKYFWGYYPMAGRLHTVFFANYILVWCYSLMLMYKHMQKKKELKDFESYRKAKYVFIAWSGGLLGVVDFLPKYGIPIYPFAYLIALYWTGISAYAILPHKPRMFLFNRSALIFSGIAAVLIIGLSAVHLLANYVSISSISALVYQEYLQIQIFKVNSFSIPPIVTSFLILASGFYILSKDRRSKTHRAFLYFSISCFIWIFCYSLAYNCLNPGTALSILRFSFIGVGFIAFTNFNFYVEALQLPVKRATLITLFVLAIVFVAVNQSSSYIYESTYQYFWGYYTKAGPLHAVFLVIWSVTWIYGSWHIYRKIQEYKRVGDFKNYRKAKFMYFAYLGECLGFIDFLPKYGIPIYPFGYIVTLYWVVIVAFAMIGHRMLADMSFLMRRVLIVSGVIGLLIVLYSILYSLVQMVGPFHVPMGTLLIAVAISLIAWVFLYPLYRKTRDFVDQAFFQEFHQRNEKMMELNQSLLISKNAFEFSENMTRAIYETFKAIRVSFFLLDGKESAFKLAAELHWGTADKAGIAIPLNNSLAEYLQTHDYLEGGEPHQEKKSQMLSSYGAQLALSIKREDEKLLGFLLLGDKESGLKYSDQDIQDLKSFAKLSAVVARSEQLLYQQVELEKLVEERTQDLIVAQENLLTKERLAAIGEITSIISHEIRTPMAILGQSLFLLEKRLSTSAKEGQVEKHLNIMKAQIHSANNILSEILDYVRSRPLLLEKGFINRLIYEVTSVIECPVKIQFILNLSKDVSETLFDSQEITQAFNNIVKNALEAMPEGGTLNIETRMRGEEIEIRFADTGCGISEGDLARIFEPLFTTKKRGTGLGMAVVKKAIDRHKWRIEIQSKVNQGTTLLIRIPPMMTPNVKIKNR